MLRSSIRALRPWRGIDKDNVTVAGHGNPMSFTRNGANLDPGRPWCALVGDVDGSPRCLLHLGVRSSIRATTGAGADRTTNERFEAATDHSAGSDTAAPARRCPCRHGTAASREQSDHHPIRTAPDGSPLHDLVRWHRLGSGWPNRASPRPGHSRSRYDGAKRIMAPARHEPPAGQPTWHGFNPDRPGGLLAPVDRRPRATDGRNQGGSRTV